ncbi:hypothetical protein GCM10010106_13160 [Thermopolyspora flexuosa]|uniref:GntR family transcriptional regulator n=1 Tax=Thermopolyspora flexuosa TaxID=103836 RepID=UPI00147724C1|nr:winged helix-turn-helix domain-containing protein [Thermopolyspora flexuosa]GGM68500.1 hypothetical protein GCM10010106_13160 [Thermopolyspora flexuosa]
MPKWRQIIERLRRCIFLGHYPPGTPLLIRDIVCKFGVGRGTAQKVLRRLRDEGLVYMERGMGAFVSPRVSEN